MFFWVTWCLAGLISMVCSIIRDYKGISVDEIEYGFGDFLICMIILLLGYVSIFMFLVWFVYDRRKNIIHAIANIGKKN